MDKSNTIDFWTATFRKTTTEQEFRQYYLKRDSKQGVFAITVFLFIYLCGGIYQMFSPVGVNSTQFLNLFTLLSLGGLLIFRLSKCDSVICCRLLPLIYVFACIFGYAHLLTMYPQGENGCSFPLLMLAALSLVPVTFFQGIIVACLLSVVLGAFTQWLSLVNPHTLSQSSLLFNIVIAGAIGALAAYRIGIHRRREFSNLMANQQIVDALQKEISERMAAEKELQRLASTDSLTNLWNRRKFMEVFEDEIARSCRYQRDLSLMVLDIDHFKRINDSFGHNDGDKALVHFAKICKSCLRDTDFIARMGGEEFAILLPETDTEGAHILGERICNIVAASALKTKQGKINMTVSIGICTMSEDTQPQRLYYRADMALYNAKENGRNRVESCPVSDFTVPEQDLCRSSYVKEIDQ
ncbi:MAG: GGDEF domain-containing protein [Desulfovibrio sp.]